MEINFYITEQSINDMSTLDYEAFERAQDGEIKVYKLRPAICRFMVDDKNQPVPYEEALRISEKLKIKQLRDFISKFFEVMKNTTVPKATGTPSPLPSEVPTAESTSPAG